MSETTTILQQKIAYILETPLGSIAHLPSFGSEIYIHIDEPEPQAVPHIIAAAYTALATWLPALHITSITPAKTEDALLLTIQANYEGEIVEASYEIS